MGRVMALDVGTKTIGVAMSDPTRLIAQPVTTISRKGVARDAAVVAELVARHAIEHLVVGLPLELDGTESRSARLARQVGEAVRERTGLPLTWIDERYTSVDAERILIHSDVSRRRRREVIDQTAAGLILQSFLDHGDWTADADSDR